jgi:hypothetical protein
MSHVQTGTQEACSYRQIEGSIHQYAFNERPGSADEHFEHLSARRPPHATDPAHSVRLAAGFPSLTYAFQKVRLEKRNPGTRRCALCSCINPAC